MRAITARNQLDLELYEYARALTARRGSELRQSATKRPEPVVRDLGPIMTPTPRNYRFMTQPSFIEMDAWLPNAFPDIALALAGLQAHHVDGRRLLEFRPRRGGRLVAMGQALLNVTEVYAVDFREDGPDYTEFRGTQQMCAANLCRHVPQADVRFWSSADERRALLKETSANHKISFAMISAPMSYRDVAEELDFLENSLSDDGAVVVFDVFNMRWPHVVEGLFAWKWGQGSLAPFLACNQALWLCRPAWAGLFMDRLTKMLPDSDYGAFAGQRLLLSMPDVELLESARVAGDPPLEEVYSLNATNPRHIHMLGANRLNDCIKISVGPGDPEAVLYGPYFPLRKGDYIAVVRFDPRVEISGECVIDVRYDIPDKIPLWEKLTAEQIIRADYEFRLDFSIDNYTFDFEIRLHASNFRAAVRGVDIFERRNAPAMP